jgi:hypothetical protein
VQVSATPGVTPLGDADAALVKVRGAGLWLVATAPEGEEPAQAYRYALPDGDRSGTDAFLREVGIDGGTSAAVEVPREWLDLFPRGGDLDEESFALQDLGEPAPGTSGARVGDYAVTDDGGVLVGDDGGLQSLSPFALALWRNLDVRGKQPKERPELEAPSAAAGYAEARWPTTTLTRVAGQTCALLESSAEAAPLVRLAGSPVEDASAELVPDPEQRLVTVDPGAGAYVVTGEWGTDTVPEPGTGSRFVVDQKGRVDALVGADTPELLGYGSYPAPLVPSSWLDLFSAGVPLSQEAALCPPQPEGGTSSCA